MRVLYLVPLGMLWAMPSWAFLSDMDVHQMPATPPSLPAAGSIATDPTFGTTILRVTDSGDSSSNCFNDYSNEPPLNINNTKIRAICKVGYKRLKVWDFNAALMTRSNGRIQANPPPGLREYEAQWSRTSPNKFYAVALKALYEITIPNGSSTTWTNTLIRDFGADFVGSYITQMSVSDNDDVFAFHYVNNNGVSTGYMAYKRSTDTILLNVSDEGSINEVEIDKSGRYLVSLKSNTTKDLHVWDLQSLPTRTTVESLLWFSHRAMGNGIVGTSCNTRRLCVRNLATPNSVTFLLPRDSWSYATQQDHFAMPGSDDAWMVGTRFHINGGPVVNPFDNEIVFIATDGSNRVRRIAHHWSIVIDNNYDAQPRASVSRDGNFIAFTSNWGKAGGRTDMYVARIQSQTTTDRTPPQSPRDLTISH
ncbi:MAG: hypothetical protein IPM58_08505 [Nitrospira sp.]|nr:hypothetical protein [Nitrospira sp.]